MPERLALELQQVSKRFGAVAALTGVSVAVRRGTLHAVLGENGAGKSTLMHVAFGLVEPDAGAVVVDGSVRVLRTPADAIAAGIGMVHQHFALVPAMTVAENLALGGRGFLDHVALRNTVAVLSQRTGFVLDPDARVESLGVGAQQRVEIAKALVRDARVLILDEPTAVLTPAESVELLAWLRAFVGAGNSAVLITHKLHEAFSVADDITVLRRGRVTLTGQVSGTSHDDVVRAMVGDDGIRAFAPADEFSFATVSQTEQRAVFMAQDLTLRRADGSLAIEGATFSIHARERVAIAGVEGAGQDVLLRALAGRIQPDRGTLERPERVGFVPEDRHRDAVLLDRPVYESVGLRGAGHRDGTMPWTAIRASTAEIVREFDVHAESIDAPVQSLSGGNQQKLVLGRELSAIPGSPAPCALVVENPTRGLDIQASVDVHQRLRDASNRGAVVVMYSSDLDEVLLLAQRVLVVFRGTVTEVACERDAIGRAMAGLNSA